MCGSSLTFSGCFCTALKDLAGNPETDTWKVSRSRVGCSRRRGLGGRSKGLAAQDSFLEMALLKNVPRVKLQQAALYDSQVEGLLTCAHLWHQESWSPPFPSWRTTLQACLCPRLHPLPQRTGARSRHSKVGQPKGEAAWPDRRPSSPCSTQRATQLLREVLAVTALPIRHANHSHPASSTTHTHTHTCQSLPMSLSP